MFLILSQTGTDASHIRQQACSPNANVPAGNRPSKQLELGGTAGGAIDVGIPGGGILRNNMWMESEANSPGKVHWNKGDWVFRINVTTAQANVTLEEVYVCRVNSTGTNQETVASDTGLGISCASTGVKSVTLTQSSDVIAAASDRIYIVPVWSKSTAGNVNLGVTMDQEIDTPIELDNPIFFGATF